MAISKFMDQVGDWNPQLLRELRGKLTKRNLIITALVSFGVQWWMFDSSLLMAFRGLQVILPSVLVIFGSYLLSYDLSKEYRQKTIEFIRLTPQSSQEILIGKILGVPILVYLAVILAIPTHFISYLSALHHSWYRDVSWLMILGSYFSWFLKAGLFYLFSLLYSLSILKRHHQNYPPSIIAGSVAFIAFLLNQFSFRIFQSSHAQWYGLKLYLSGLLSLAWFIIIGLVVGYFLWKILNRQFQNSQATLMTKKQSYQMTIFLNLFLLGFIIHSRHLFEFSFFWLFAILPSLSLALMIVLFPSHQYLLDWSRYGHIMRHKGFWQDLIFGEKSPPILAILVNALLSTAIWMICLLLTSPNELSDVPNLSTFQLLLCPLITISMILIYVMVAQILMMNQQRNAKALVIIGMTTLVMIPPFASLIFIVNRIQIPWLWLFTPFPIVGFYKISLLASIAGLSLQLAILGMLTAKLKQQIYLAGASETQTLFNSH